MKSTLKLALGLASAALDFWAEPSYAPLLQASQKRFHDYVVAGQGSAKDALDGLVKDWTQIFQDDGKM